MVELYEAAVNNSCRSAVQFQINSICINAVGGDLSDLTEWIMSLNKPSKRKALLIHSPNFFSCICKINLIIFNYSS